MKAYEALIQLGSLSGGLWSTERPGTRASNSELRRWFKNGSVQVNHELLREPEEILDYPVVCLVIHPKSKHRNTLIRRHY